MILTKILGAGCIVLGFFFVVYLPGVPDYQPENMAWTFVFFGIFLILLGIYLVKV